MRRYVVAVLVGAGILFTFPLFGMIDDTMVRIPTSTFRASCPEIKPAVVA